MLNTVFMNRHSKTTIALISMLDMQWEMPYFSRGVIFSVRSVIIEVTAFYERKQ